MVSHFVRFLILLVLLSLSAKASGGVFSLDRGQPGRVLWQGRPLLVRRSFTVDGREFLSGGRCSFGVLSCGGEVFNSERRDGVPFREEIGVTSGGRELEITFSARVAVDGRSPARTIGMAYVLEIPLAHVAGRSYRGVTGRISSNRVISGRFTDRDLTLGRMRALAIEDGEGGGLVFDFNPKGVGDFDSDYGSPRGMLGVTKSKSGLRIVLSDSYDSYGLGLTGKIKIFHGSFRDYRARHALELFDWGTPFKPVRLFSFGGNPVGSDYTPAGHVMASPGSSHGWLPGADSVSHGGGAVLLAGCVLWSEAWQERAFHGSWAAFRAVPCHGWCGQLSRHSPLLFRLVQR